MAEARPPNPASADGPRQNPGGAAQPIVSPGGTVLMEDGHRLAPALNEAQLRSKLLAAVGESIAPEEEMTPARLAAAIEELLEREDILADLMPGIAERRQLFHIFSTLPLSGRMRVKLAIVARDREDLLVHSLRTAFCAGAVAQRMHMARHEVAEAVAAGLFHDLGLLHVDPALLQRGRHLENHERHHLDVHPLAGYLILEDEPAWHPVVSTAVLEHHERMDGSGYPRGHAGSRLGALGQLLAVAELAATLLTPGNPALSWLRLGVVLRLNAEKLNRDFVYCLLESFPPTAIPHAGRGDLGQAIETLVRIVIAFQGWHVMRQTATGPLVAFIGHRMDHLGRNLADAGIDLEFWQEIDAEIERDALSLGEIRLAAQEGMHQLKDIADEARRRWAKLQPAAPEAAAWIEQLEALSRGS